MNEKRTSERSERTAGQGEEKHHVHVHSDKEGKLKKNKEIIIERPEQARASEIPLIDNFLPSWVPNLDRRHSTRPDWALYEKLKAFWCVSCEVETDARTSRRRSLRIDIYYLPRCESRNCRRLIEVSR
jgi:hypothetical protein